MAPAIANAVYDAVGVRIMDLPITAEKVFRALQAQTAENQTGSRAGSATEDTLGVEERFRVVVFAGATEVDFLTDRCPLQVSSAQDRKSRSSNRDQEKS